MIFCKGGPAISPYSADSATLLLLAFRGWQMFCGILLSMQVTLAHIGSRGGAKDGYEALVSGYLKRCAGVMRCSAEAFRSEARCSSGSAGSGAEPKRSSCCSTGAAAQMSSEALAEWLGKRRDEGAQHVVFAVGPADGWSEEALAEGKRRGGLLSLGPMTLAHQLARLVVAEQIYRACTILTGHPYHRGTLTNDEL